MKISNIQNQQNFKGYKNILSFSMGDNKNFSYGYMAMKLNNENGHKDLETWQKIQRVLNPSAEPSDLILFQNTQALNADVFIVNDFVLDINNEYTGKKLSKEREDIAIKANTLVASLTKRIMNAYYHPEDQDLYKTLVFAYDKIKVTLNEETANELVTYLGAIKKVKHNVTAKVINDGIMRNMNKFFR